MREHRVLLRRYESCLSGSDLVNWLVVNNHAPDPAAAVVLAQQLMDVAGLTSITGGGEIILNLQGRIFAY